MLKRCWWENVGNMAEVSPKKGITKEHGKISRENLGIPTEHGYFEGPPMMGNTNNIAIV
jgi:hypothetical protein